MISKNLIKLIKSLEQKKYRKREKLFVAEGPKVVGDLMALMAPQRIIATSEWYKGKQVSEDVVVTEDEIRKVSFLQHPQDVLALFELPEMEDLGTIIRLADWFGIEHILCNQGTADAYSPKVVQATMGSIARVKLHYTNLAEYLEQLQDAVPVYGTFLDGNNLYAEKLSPSGIIIMGNEGNGISEQVERYVTKRLLIPSYPAERPTAESLNVAIATAITCAEFRRKN